MLLTEEGAFQSDSLVARTTGDVRVLEGIYNPIGKAGLELVDPVDRIADILK